jgi:DUF438 domain-containing protein
MSDLIDRLKNEHTEIIDMLLRAKSLSRRDTSGLRQLPIAKDLLISHLKKEDNELYSYLMERAKEDVSLKNQVIEFISEMRDITEKVIAFFDRYTEKIEEQPKTGSILQRLKDTLFKGTKKDEFQEEFEKIYSLILDRIHKEENTLYPLYLKLKSSETTPQHSK